MNNAIIFVRGNDAIRQMELCKNFAKNEGYNVFGVTQDVEDLKQFPENTNAVIVVNMTRLGRKADVVLGILANLADKGIRVVTVEKERKQCQAVTRD